jgi:hypothetical protein
MYFVKITDAHFMPDMYPLDHVQQCNRVFAKWVIDHDYGVIVDSEGNPITDPLYTPHPQSGTIKDAAPAVLSIGWSAAIAVTDSTGMTVSVDGSAGEIINNVVADERSLNITMAVPFVFGQEVTFSYDGDLGNVTHADWVALKGESISKMICLNAVESEAGGASAPPPPAPPEPDPIPDPMDPDPVDPDPVDP